MSKNIIHVIASAVMLGAVSTTPRKSVLEKKVQTTRSNLPLRHGLITTYVSSLASLATLSRLGMALARRSTTRPSHYGYMRGLGSKDD